MKKDEEKPVPSEWDAVVGGLYMAAAVPREDEICLVVSCEPHVGSTSRRGWAGMPVRPGYIVEYVYLGQLRQGFYTDLRRRLDTWGNSWKPVDWDVKRGASNGND